MSRGHQRERDLVNILREEGWFALRAPASKGEVDVVAIRHGNVEFYEVKSTAAGPYAHFGPADRAALRAEADRAGADAILCWWPPRKAPEFIPARDWPKSKT